MMRLTQKEFLDYGELKTPVLARTIWRARTHSRKITDELKRFYQSICRKS
jgi:hypothetical protein